MIELGTYDIIIGNGKGNQHHPGNKRFQRIILKFAPKYIEAARLSKQQLIPIILQVIKNGNKGRFLRMRYERGKWEVLSESVASSKIINAIQYCISKNFRDQANVDTLSINDNDDVKVVANASASIEVNNHNKSIHSSNAGRALSPTLLKEAPKRKKMSYLKSTTTTTTTTAELQHADLDNNNNKESQQIDDLYNMIPTSFDNNITSASSSPCMKYEIYPYSAYNSHVVVIGSSHDIPRSDSIFNQF